MGQKKEGRKREGKWKWETLTVPNICYGSTPLDFVNAWQEFCCRTALSLLANGKKSKTVELDVI